MVEVPESDEVGGTSGRNDSTSTPCYLLCAPDSPPARLQSASAQLDALGIAFTPVTGFGPDDPGIAARYSPWRNLLGCKRSISNREIAVSLGHRLIWETLLREGHEHALILEDDFTVLDADRLTRALACAPDLLRDWDMIKLFDFRARTPYVMLARMGLRFAVHTRPNSGLVGYLVSRGCCEALLANMMVYRPVDEDIRYWFETGIRICSVTPNVVSDNADKLGGSLIAEEREAARGRRNVLRSVWGNVLTVYIKAASWFWVRRVTNALPAEWELSSG